MDIDTITRLIEQFRDRPPNWPITFCFGGHSVTIKEIQRFIPCDGEDKVCEMGVKTREGEPRMYFFQPEAVTCIYEVDDDRS